MTTISTISEFLDELDELLETKDNPDEWYVVSGAQCGEYSIYTDEAPEEFDESELPPEEQDATENVDGYYQIGTQGWSAQAFNDDVEFVSEVGFSRSYDVIDRRINGMLLVHEDALSEKTLEIATDGGQPVEEESVSEINHAATPDIDRQHVSVTVDPEEITRKISALNEFVDEVRLHFREDYIETTVVDPANVVAANITIDVEYQTGIEPFTIAVSTAGLLDAMDFSDAFGDIELKVTEDSDELTVGQDYLNDWAELWDPDVLRDHSDVFDIDTEISATATAPALKFKGAVGAITGTRDTGTTIRARDSEIVVENADYEGPKEDREYYYTWALDATVSGDVRAMYASNFLNYVVSAIQPEGDVRLEFRDDLLLVKTENGDKFALAPRISAEVDSDD